MNIMETQLENLVNKPAYRIDKVNVQFGTYTPEPMLKLMIKIGDAWVFVERKDIHYGPKVEAMYLRDLTEMGESHKEDSGFFCVYGKGKPLDELQDQLNDATHFGLLGEGVWTFAGNHEQYSGAFQYWVWDPKLIEQIKNSLLFQGIKATENDYWYSFVRYPVTEDA